METDIPTDDEAPPKRTLALTVISVCLRSGGGDPKRAVRFCDNVETNVRQILARHARQGVDAQIDRVRSFVECLSADLPQNSAGRVRLVGFSARRPFDLTIPIVPTPPL